MADPLFFDFNIPGSALMVDIGFGRKHQSTITNVTNGL